MPVQVLLTVFVERELIAILWVPLADVLLAAFLGTDANAVPRFSRFLQPASDIPRSQWGGIVVDVLQEHNVTVVGLTVVHEEEDPADIRRLHAFIGNHNANEYSPALPLPVYNMVSK